MSTQNFNRARQRQHRKALRANSTPAEQALWHHLRHRQLGVRFRRQYSVDAFILDFYAPSVRLAIEVDGDSHFTDAAVEYDGERSTFLESFGIEVLRFTNVDVKKNTEAVMVVIEAAVRRRLGDGC